MTTDEPESTFVVSDSETSPATSDLTNLAKTASSTMDTDRVSAAMGQYMLQGWAMLNDGCPDCNTPLMRNREATSQICVNCELNPPVDPEEAEMTPARQQPETGVEETEAAQPAQLPPPPPMAPMSAPAPTSALPSVPANAPPLGPGGLRPVAQQNHRVSVLDPMMEARRALRPVGARSIGAAAPAPPLTPPPPRASTPLPPPPAAAKTVSGPLGSKMAIPLPPGPPPPALPLSPAPAGTLGPQPVPRDMRRSPQTSIIISGNILPPSTPPPAPPAQAPPANPLPTPPAQQSPPASSGSAAHPEVAGNGVLEEPEAAQVAEDSEQVTKVEATMEEAVATEEVAVPGQDSSATEDQPEENPEEAPELTLEPVQEDQEEPQELTLEPVQEDQGEPQEQDQAAEDEEKAAESDDDFEDAEEEVFKPTEEELKEREARREQSERASRLIGQKMLQGWAMLQDPCPNAACHGVPLLANREKKEYCVVCENYFQREKNLEHGKYTVVTKEVAAASTPTTTESNTTPFTTAAILPPPVTALPPPPQAVSPPIAPKRRSTLSSPIGKVVSPVVSPSMGRSHRELLGRVSGSIVLPPAASMSPSLGMTSQQILGKHLSDDLDKLASEDEEARKHIQIIRKVGEFSNKSLPPVPNSPFPAPPQGSRPVSTYSSSSEYHPSEGERHETTRPLRHYHSQRLNQVHNPPSTSASSGPHSEISTPAPTPAPLSAEVQALVAATHKTIATILVKLEAYRQALEVSESPKECQVLTNQIKGLMECLKACRETL
ncbi:hypothetical protein KVV02_001912 [Mortierella alpina]|uniref:Uncharacterized protein n=1 Tax=Mortierella alpina TaxID=64518 RepID=A0A9P8D0K8_MORAP|nr:hypothetical protein KVV02_001912 [Mortierella alpina]